MDNYYYLIASLPDLSLEKPIQVDADDVCKRILDNLTYEDSIYFEFLLLPNDHQNIAAQLGPRAHNYTHLSPGKYSVYELQSLIRFPANFPDYIYQIIQEQTSHQTSLAPDLIEAKLMQGFYEIALACQDDFIRRYYQFDLDLRSILMSWNLTKLKFDEASKANYLAMMNPLIAEKLKLNQYESLKLEYPWLDPMQSLFNAGKLLEMETLIDKIRWDYIEQLASGSFFNKHAVFAYFARLLIVDRRNKLGNETGEHRLTETRKKLRNEFLALTQPTDDHRKSN